MVFLFVASLAPGASALTAGVTAVGRAQTATPSSGAKVDLVISNTQFCRQAPCLWPTEAAYSQGMSGPLPGSDNLNKFVAVSPGDTITWTYKDTAEGGPASCDFFGTPPHPDNEALACVGHGVTLEDGTEEGRTLGFLAARSGPGTITWVVPTDVKPGSVIRYFCNVRDLSATVPGGFTPLAVWHDRGAQGGRRPHRGVTEEPLTQVCSPGVGAGTLWAVDAGDHREELDFVEGRRRRAGGE
jgi:hypothetical protein